MKPKIKFRTNIAIFKVVLIMVLLSAANYALAASRVSNYEEAKPIAETGKEIAVFLHGSDWCQLGEYVKKKIWDKDSFSKALGADIVMVPVDSIEQSDDHLKALLTEDEGKVLKIKNLASNAKSTFTLQSDGSYLVTGDNPRTDVYTFTALSSSQKPITAIAIEGIGDASLPAQGPGRANNGNFILTEIQVAIGNTNSPTKLVAAWSDNNNDSWPPMTAIDGDFSNANGWSRRHHHIKDCKLIVVPSAPIPKNSKIFFQLHFLSKHGQHTLGRFRVREYRGTPLAAETMRWRSQKILAKKNKPLKANTSNYPAIVLCDSEGVAYGGVHGIQMDASPTDIVSELHSIIPKQKKRSDLWARAEKIDGREKASLIGQGLDIKGLTLDRKKQKSLVEEIKKADPEDKTGYLRKYTFNAGTYHRAANELVDAGKHEEGLALLDKELAHPMNKLLTSDQIQQLHLGKFHVYKKWKGHEDERFNICRDIIKVDPTTHIGIGMHGYLLMFHTGPVTISYGWGPTHMQEGAMTWDIDEDTAKYFNHAGPYRVTLTNDRGGKHSIDIQSIALLADGKIVSEDKHAGICGPALHSNNDYKVSLPRSRNTKKITLRIKCNSSDGLESKGRIKITPLLELTGE